MMTVAQLIVWLQAQPQDACVDIGMNMEYQDPLCPETCQLTEWEGVQYVLLGEEIYGTAREEIFLTSDGVRVA